MADAHVQLDPAGMARLGALVDRFVERITDAVAQDARRLAPVDTGEMLGTIRAEHLGRRGRVWVGTDHWAPTEYGSRPHPIRVRRAKVLYNHETGQFFGTAVNHPGTPEQPFMRPALYRYRLVRF